MKKFAICFLISLVGNGIFARNVDDIVNQRIISKPIYTLKSRFAESMVFNMVYGKNEILSENDRKILSKAEVLSIDLVYTDFPKGQDLTSLNKKRIEQVYGWRKDLITNSSITWNIIKQTACKNEAEAKVLFHGIVIHYVPFQDEKTTELDLLTLAGLPAKGDSLEKMVTKNKPYGIYMQDSTIIAVFNRNKDWKEMLIVSDMTGSMSPFAVQMLVWFQLKMKDGQVRKTVFFNDGDSKLDHLKTIGSTGGIYMVESAKYEDVLACALKTMQKGNGGDGPENNVEALIKGIEETPNAKEIIMIADNYAPVKDIKLIDNIQKPVRVIVCKADHDEIHPDYLKIARKTKGSIHTMNEDILNLAKLNEGQTVEINKIKYKVVRDELVRL